MKTSSSSSNLGLNLQHCFPSFVLSWNVWLSPSNRWFYLILLTCCSVKMTSDYIAAVVRGSFCWRTSLGLGGRWVLTLHFLRWTQKHASFQMGRLNEWLPCSELLLLTGSALKHNRCMRGIKWFDNLDSDSRNPVGIVARLVYLSGSSCLDGLEVSVSLLK